METEEQAAFRCALAEVLQGLREGDGLSLEDAAAAAGISASRLASLEEGARDPWFTEVIALARLYGVDPDTDLVLDLLVAVGRSSAGCSAQVPRQETTPARRRTD